LLTSKKAVIGIIIDISIITCAAMARGKVQG
jgi:hypothetical protein